MAMMTKPCRMVVMACAVQGCYGADSCITDTDCWTQIGPAQTGLLQQSVVYSVMCVPKPEPVHDLPPNCQDWAFGTGCRVCTYEPPLLPQGSACLSRCSPATPRLPVLPRVVFVPELKGKSDPQHLRGGKTGGSFLDRLLTSFARAALQLPLGRWSHNRANTEAQFQASAQAAAAVQESPASPPAAKLLTVTYVSRLAREVTRHKYTAVQARAAAQAPTVPVARSAHAAALPQVLGSAEADFQEIQSLPPASAVYPAADISSSLDRFQQQVALAKAGSTTAPCSPSPQPPTPLAAHRGHVNLRLAPSPSPHLAEAQLAIARADHSQHLKPLPLQGPSDPGQKIGAHEDDSDDTDDDGFERDDDEGLYLVDDDTDAVRLDPRPGFAKTPVGNCRQLAELVKAAPLGVPTEILIDQGLFCVAEDFTTVLPDHSRAAIVVASGQEILIRSAQAGSWAELRVTRSEHQKMFALSLFWIKPMAKLTLQQLLLTGDGARVSLMGYYQYYQSSRLATMEFGSMLQMFDTEASLFAYRGGGGAIRAEDSTIKMRNAALAQNIAGLDPDDSGPHNGNGGAIFSVRGSVEMDALSDMRENTAQGCGGAIYMEGGGALTMRGLIRSNRAQDGGGMCFRSGTEPKQLGLDILLEGKLEMNEALGQGQHGQGGGMFIQRSGSDPSRPLPTSVRISPSSTIFANRAAGHGGGLALQLDEADSNAARVHVQGLVVGNSAEGQGGGVYIHATQSNFVLDIDTVGTGAITSNTALDGSAIYASGNYVEHPRSEILLQAGARVSGNEVKEGGHEIVNLFGSTYVSSAVPAESCQASHAYLHTVGGSLCVCHAPSKQSCVTSNKSTVNCGHNNTEFCALPLSADTTLSSFTDSSSIF